MTHQSWNAKVAKAFNMYKQTGQFDLKCTKRSITDSLFTKPKPRPPHDHVATCEKYLKWPSSLSLISQSFFFFCLLNQQPDHKERKKRERKVASFPSFFFFPFTFFAVKKKNRSVLASRRGRRSPFEDEKTESLQSEIDESSFRVSEKTPKI